MHHFWPIDNAYLEKNCDNFGAVENDWLVMTALGLAMGHGGTGLLSEWSNASLCIGRKRLQQASIKVWPHITKCLDAIQVLVPVSRCPLPVLDC